MQGTVGATAGVGLVCWARATRATQRFETGGFVTKLTPAGKKRLYRKKRKQRGQ